MRIEEDATREAVRRLRRIEGQVAGIVRMIDSGRDCKDVITQISAASNALDQVGFKLLASGLRDCLTGQDAAEDAAAEFERLFLKLA